MGRRGFTSPRHGTSAWRFGNDPPLCIEGGRGYIGASLERGKPLSWSNDRVGELDDWQRIKLLTVRVDRLRRWYRPGLLCIGDAAHAMSPVGGVGINLAIQDAVAAANLLTEPLRNATLTETHLLRVQRRRELPTRVIQRLQMLIQNQVIANVLASRGTSRPPLALRVIGKVPGFRRFLARLVGIGIRPEHVRAPARRA